MKTDYDAIIVGAGAAGLAALRELDRAGRRVVCLEARDRIGGRVYTVHDPLSPMPIELGAEFIHGRAPEIWNLVRSQNLLAYDCADSAVHVKDGRIVHGESGWELVDEMMRDMQKAAETGEDRSFADFAAASSHSENAKQLASSYVEGFNAARKEIVGIASLAKDAKASDEIDGDHSFRFLNGYDGLIHSFAAAVNDRPSKLRANAVVRRIEWSPGQATVHAEFALTGHSAAITAARVIVTAPLPVLTEHITFAPEPDEALQAAQRLEFGQVMRVVLRFRKAFWEENKELAEAGFLLSNEKFFPTWWVMLPVRTPLITGWSAGPHADDLLGASRSAVIDRALHDLARITSTRKRELDSLLEAAHFHDWNADPFAGGAYSYVPVGALSAREVLAKPIADTLYFAGEATETNGHSATVHGAIASGQRAARQILESG